ncbi:MAG: serine hydrolase domain-containing protein [Verrucomicrobium sp.]|nr:serine hydrolase [Verrucomicrobium sp.]
MHASRRTFLKQIGSSLALTSWAPAGMLWADDKVPTSLATLPRSTPEAQGISSAAIQAFLDGLAAAKHEMHGLVMVRRGHVIAEGWWAPYAPDLRHTLYSMSKSFTSTAVGFAVAEGRLKVTDKVVSFFPKDLPEQVSDNLAALTVKDLLTMSVGNEKEPTQTVVKSENWVRTFLAQTITHTPGTVFMYNSAATYMCSAIVQKLTGQPILQYLTPRLFEPLGIQSPTWESCPLGINTGGWGLSVPTGALAKFGQLYLQKGQWQGKQILPAAWIEEATSFKIQQPDPAKPSRPKEKNDWLQGYAYQFWRCQNGAYRGDGAFGQFTIVLPEQETVIAINSETSGMQDQLDLVWEHLLPALKKDATLPADAVAEGKLRSTLAGLNLPPLAGQSGAQPPADVSGKWFALETNGLGIEQVKFDLKTDSVVFTAKAGGKEHVIGCGQGSWQKGETGMPGTPPRLISGGASPAGTPFKVAASAAWTKANTLEMMWRYYETPHHDSVTCEFEGSTVKVAFLNSLAKKQANPKDSRGVLQGKLA